jgi:hypothetical protein
MHEMSLAESVREIVEETARVVQIEQDILAKNNAYASANRKDWQARGLFAINLVSSPGSGKTTLLVETIGCSPAAIRWR